MGNATRWEAASPEAMGAVAKALLKALPVKQVAFYGEMGSGKTTLIRHLCQELGVPEADVTSPTFSLVNVYEGAEQIFHLDLYRVEAVEELYDIGYEEIFYGEDWVFVEWPERAGALLPDDFARVNLKIEADGKRAILLEYEDLSSP